MSNLKNFLGKKILIEPQRQREFNEEYNRANHQPKLMNRQGKRTQRRTLSDNTKIILNQIHNHISQNNGIKYITQLREISCW